MSGGGEHNAKAGSSSRQKKSSYWELLEEYESQEQQLDPNFVPAADEEMEDESSDDEMEEADGQEDVSTTDGGGGGEATDGGSQQDPNKPKKARKDRTPITVGLIRQEFTEVNDEGELTAPEEFVSGYANQVCAILRNTVTINTEIGRAHV